MMMRMTIILIVKHYYKNDNDSVGVLDDNDFDEEI
jgi:hypothetical protein